MERHRIHHVLLLAAVLAAGGSGSAWAGQLRAWGSNSDGQITGLPLGSSFVGIAAGDAHGLALRADGTLVAWGQNDDGECRVPTGTFQAIGAGADCSLAVRTDGSLAAWGEDAEGIVSKVPLGKTFVAVDGGLKFAVALRADGSIVAWGEDDSGQVSRAPKGAGFKMVAAGDQHGIALRTNGSLVTWGAAASILGTPTSGTFTAIAAGGAFCLALRSDGSLLCWGADPYQYGLARVPAGTDYVAIAAGYLHCLALKKDGSVVGWGAGTDNSAHPDLGQAKPPTARDHIAIAAGLYYSLALTAEAVKAAISDDFDDNQQSSLWKLYGDDLSNCWVSEANHRLELRATARTRVTPAYYFAKGWQLDSTKDFAFKVSYHYDVISEPTGWVSVGLTPDEKDLNANHIEFGPGCGRLYSHLWWEALDGVRPRYDFADRDGDDGVLYVSYDAKADELYLSTTGYGIRNAWGVVGGVLQGSWRGRPVSLYLGGGSDGQEIKSGAAWLDNFAVDVSSPAVAGLSEVYRFWSQALADHFYTIDRGERDRLIKDYPYIWSYEGPVFKASAQNAPGMAPVWRFWSARFGHYYTIDTSEKQRLLERYKKDWTFEGVAFYAYPEGAQPVGSRPVYQFYRPADGGHFYTINTAERDLLLKEYAAVFVLERIAFYAFE
ncbi:MAG: hypothetical protein MUC88_12980 [Planctomycetes bacterium]|nr:hypothetical protein [Planctomycetota bacterium]